LKSVYRLTLILGFGLVGAFLSGFSGAWAGEEEPAACQVKVELKRGAVFDAVVKDKGVVDYLKKNEALDLDKLDSRARLTLYYMNGMSGTTAVTLGDVKSVKRLMLLDKKTLDEMVATITQRIEKVRTQEAEREKVEAEKRTLRREEAAEQSKERAEKKKEQKEKTSEQEKIKWILRFPPDAGWGPEKKEELYRRSMVVGVFPNAEEQAFLDHYQEWTEQFEYWKQLEEQRKAEEAKRKEEEKTKEPSQPGKAPNG